ncbi:hypothetical protein D3C71_1856540 [compost metagenome]
MIITARGRGSGAAATGRPVRLDTAAGEGDGKGDATAAVTVGAGAADDSAALGSGDFSGSPPQAVSSMETRAAPVSRRYV